jgi:hypothetical protein
LGTFIADFENAFPHARIVNIAVEPDGSATETIEKLAFRMDIIFLAKQHGTEN